MFAISSIAGIMLMSLLTGLLHSNAAVTTDPVLAAVFGGLAIGVGSGIVIRYGGTLDGTEILAILAEKRSPFSVGELIMAMNLLILGSAGFVFGWDKAMYSLIAYVVAYKAMDITAEGLDQSKSVWIVSDEYLQIGEAIQRELGRKVTYVNGRSADGLVSSGVILSVITRIEEQKLKSAVSACDPRAFVVISDVHEVMSHHFQGRA
jgi:uncharacterized membrane-anchored protein YitT (DUF2179 family)